LAQQLLAWQALLQLQQQRESSLTGQMAMAKHWEQGAQTDLRLL